VSEEVEGRGAIVLRDGGHEAIVSDVGDGGMAPCACFAKTAGLESQRFAYDHDGFTKRNDVHSLSRRSEGPAACDPIRRAGGRSFFIDSCARGRLLRTEARRRNKGSRPGITYWTLLSLEVSAAPLAENTGRPSAHPRSTAPASHQTRERGPGARRRHSRAVWGAEPPITLAKIEADR